MSQRNVCVIPRTEKPFLPSFFLSFVFLAVKSGWDPLMIIIRAGGGFSPAVRRRKELVLAVLLPLFARTPCPPLLACAGLLPRPERSREMSEAVWTNCCLMNK